MPCIRGDPLQLYQYHLYQKDHSTRLHSAKKHHGRQSMLKVHKFEREILLICRNLSVKSLVYFPKAHSQVQIQSKHCVLHIFEEVIQIIKDSNGYLHN